MMQTSYSIFMMVLLVLLLGFSAFFSGAETALMSISRLRLRHLAETKPRRARLVEHILKVPEQLIGTILLGNNLVNVAMSAIATALAISFWGERGIIYVTFLLTFFILVFAEITPKVYAKYFNERVSFIIAPLLNRIMILFHPVVLLITSISNKILLLLGVDASKMKRPLLTEDEVKTCIKMGWDEGAITAEERSILSRVFTLNDKTVADIMVPKDKIVVLDMDTPMEQIVQTILKTGHSRFPVKKGNDLEIVGSMHAKDLFRLKDRTRSSFLKKILRPPYFVPHERTIDAQLRRFQAKKLHQAIVIDAEGKVAGLITMEDILEELVGAIEDEHD